MGVNLNEDRTWVIRNAAVLNEILDGDSIWIEGFYDEIGLYKTTTIAVSGGRLRPEKGRSAQL